MSAGDFLAGVGQALLDAIDPLRQAITDPSQMNALLRREGWRPPLDGAYFTGLSAALALGGDVENVATSLEALFGGDLSLAEVQAAIDAATKLLRDLSAVAKPAGNLLPPPLDRDDFWSSFPLDLAQDLLITWVEKAHPALFAPLHLLGVLDESLVVPATGDVTHLPYSQRRVRWDRLPMLVSDPASLPRDVYGWGGNFDSGKLLLRLETVLRALGVLTGRPIPAGELAAHYYPTALPPNLLMLRATLLRERSANAGVELGLLVLPIPAAGGGAPVGIFLGPSVEGAAAASLPISGPLSLQLAGGLETSGLVGLELRPGQVTPRLDGAAGTLALSATLAAKPREPIVLIGARYADRLELIDFSFGVELSGALTDPEFKLRLHTGGLQLVLDPSQGDSFLQDIFGSDPQTVKAGCDLVWSSKTGLHFDGQAALKLTIPIDFSFGPARVSQILIEAAAASGSGVTVSLGLSGGGKLGPLSASVQDIGVALSLTPAPPPASGTFGDLALGFGFKSPSGFGLALDAGVVTGGGFVGHVGDEYQGALELSVCGVTVKAYGLIDTKLPAGAPGYSALIILSTEFNPGIQLGYGFTLDGVGGLVGIHRTLSLANVQSAIWSRYFDGLLFPKDPVVAAPSLMTSIDSFFPAAPGRYLFGPLAKIGWGEGMIEALLGLIIELPEPVKLLLLGEIDILIPKKLPQLQLHIDFDGGIDFGQKLAFFDASLHDSKIERYPIAGDLAFRYGWGDDPVFALAIGGFNPHYQPPANFPDLKRLSISIGTPGVQLTASGYFALTSNTLQLGARVELTAGASALNVHGWLGFDALVEWNPFSFTFDLSAGVDMRSGSTTLASVHLDGSVTGTSPWHVSGEASISFWFFDLSVHFDKQWGDTGQALPAPNPTPAVVQALQSASAWSAVPPANAIVTAAGDAQGAVLFDPGGGLRVTQRVVPLGQAITRFGGTALASPVTLNLDGAKVFGDASPSDATEEFALAQFQDLSDAQKLSLPSFTRMKAGVELGDEAVSLGRSGRPQTMIMPLSYDTTVIDSVTRPGTSYAPAAATQLAMNQQLRPAPRAPSSIQLGDDRWVVAGTSDLKARADVSGDGSKLGALTALANYLAAHPEARGQLQVVLAQEAA